MFRTKPGEGRALIEDWINRPSLRKLVEAFDGTWPDGDLEHVVAQLVEFSEVWDYRGGTQSRLMFHEDSGTPDPFEDLTYEAADELGLMNPRPPSDDNYDYLLILGGLATGVEPRVQYASQLVEQGLNVRHQIAGLGSYRELYDKELSVSRRYAPRGQHEIEHLAAMMAAILGGSNGVGDLVSAYPVTNAGVWELPQTRTDRPRLVAYSAANALSSNRPANTAETYDLFLDAASVVSGETALLVTSSIYVPYQHLEAVRVLGARQLEIETVGLVATSLHRHPATAYRQEVRSALRSAHGYITALQQE